MPKKILVIDDKQELRTLLKSYLTQEGFNVWTAGDGQEALFVARREKPDILAVAITSHARMQSNVGQSTLSDRPVRIFF